MQGLPLPWTVSAFLVAEAAPLGDGLRPVLDGTFTGKAARGCRFDYRQDLISFCRAVRIAAGWSPATRGLRCEHVPNNKMARVAATGASGLCSCRMIGDVEVGWR